MAISEILEKLGIAALFFGPSLFLGACFEPKEGCLDISATNFNVEADKDCCCEYPKLILTVDQVYADTLFLNNMLFRSDGGDIFRINGIAFYLSDFSLYQNGSAYTVSDTIRLRTYDGADSSSATFTNDFLLVRRSPIDYTVGTFRQDGSFERLRFRLGLPDKAHQVVPSRAPANHPLAPQADRLWLGTGTGYACLQAVVTRDSMGATAPDTLRFSQAELGPSLLQFIGDYRHPTGYDFRLTLRADYKKLFRGVNWSVHDITAWKTQMAANLPSVFSVSQ